MKTKLNKKADIRVPKGHSSKPHLSKHGFDNALISWRAPEYEQHEKTILWFIIAGAIALGLIVYGIMTDGWTFSVAVAVFSGVYYLVYRREAQIVDIKISNTGVMIGRHKFHYGRIKNFWVLYEPPFVQRLYFREASRLHPDFYVSLRNVDHTKVCKILSEHITELDGKHEAFSDVLVRLFKL